MSNLPRSCAPMMPNGDAVPASKARSEPCSLVSIAPTYGLNESNCVSITISPRVAVSKMLRSPIRARVAITYSIVVEPRPSAVSTALRLSMSPLRRLSASMQLPAQSDGTVTSTFSKGSHLTPSMFLMITVGGPMKSSKPSRRIDSTSTERCSWPRPDTSYVSALSVSATRSATFRSSSFINRSRITRDVSSLPSRPAIGDLLTPKVMRTVGSSMAIGSSGTGVSGSVTVSPIRMSSKPATTTISPASASCTDLRPSASKTKSSAMRVFLLGSSLGRASTACVPETILPCVMRPMPSLPLKSS
mmetsp:Transcript_5373/g.16852  ORF Transcript_5373/g.16852 Transcript_5373/m.16852 type:complete len:303 (+) Transcript_5373:554-1462(+)